MRCWGFSVPVADSRVERWLLQRPLSGYDSTSIPELLLSFATRRVAMQFAAKTNLRLLIVGLSSYLTEAPSSCFLAAML